jgi:hypothetical protein
MDKDLFIESGLYVNFRNNNTIEQVFVNKKKRKKFKQINYKCELQNFHDCDLSEFESEIIKLAEIEFDKLNNDELKNIINRCFEIAKDIYSINNTLGALIISTFTDIVFDKDLLLNVVARIEREESARKLSLRLFEVLHIQNNVRKVFSLIRHKDLFQKRIGQEVITCKSFRKFENGIEKNFLFFNYVKNYYDYLLFLFCNRKEQVCECELCSRCFIPKTKKKTLYCDRVYKDGKTCKQLGPIIKHKMLTDNDLVLQTFEKEKNKMYKRMERTYIYGDTPKSIQEDEYIAWLDKALQARNMYLNNEITNAEALEIIMTD